MVISDVNISRVKNIVVAVPLPEPWTPAQATDRIRLIAKDPKFTLTLREHAADQLLQRDLTTADALHVLKNGFVHANAVPATQLGLFRYAVEGPTPNSNGRRVRVIVIPSVSAANAKIVTVMWADEPLQGG